MATSLLCDEIVVEILSRLPVKSLFQCRCVSRSWCNLIDLKLRWRALPTRMLGFLYQRITESERTKVKARSIRLGVLDADDCQIDKTLSFLPPGVLYLEHCSNGLFLCRSIPVEAGCYNFYVCNPATKRWVTLPMLNNNPQLWPLMFLKASMFLAYDPFTSPHFKVLRIDREDNGERKFRIFSSEKGCWGDSKAIELPPDVDFSGCWCPVCLKGTLCWVTLCWVPGSHVVIFDIAEEVFRCIAVPDGAIQPFVGKSGGYLCCASITVSNDVAELRTWMLDGCYNNHQWQLKHSSSLNDQLKRFRSREIDDAYVMAFHESSNVVYIFIDYEAFAYDLEKKEFGNSRLSLFMMRRIFPYSPCWLDDWLTEDMKVLLSRRDSFPEEIPEVE